MALTTTTLSSACAATDTTISLTAATGVGPGTFFLVDAETMQATKSYIVGALQVSVLRGLEGSTQTAHVSGANVSLGATTDFTAPAPPSTTTFPAGRVRTLTSYSATGALALPAPGSDAVAVLNGTATLAMTLAAPTKDLDGSMLTVIGNGKSASTVTVTAGYGAAGAGYTVLTMQNAGQVGFILMACNAAWVIIGAPIITGTSAKVSIAVA